MTNKESIMKFVDAGITGLDAITGGGKCKGKSKKSKSKKSCKSHKSSKSHRSHSSKSHRSSRSNRGGCYGGSGW